MRRAKCMGDLLPPSSNPSDAERGMRKPSLAAGEGSVRGTVPPKRWFAVDAGGGSEGFTVVELYVVMAIIALFMIITVPKGLDWIDSHRFTAMVRSFPNALLMARMRGIENRSVITITGSGDYSTTTPFSSCCPGIVFTTNVDHGLSPPLTFLSGSTVVLTNSLVCSTTVGCPGTYCSPVSGSFCRKNLVSNSTIAGDVVMISGLDKHLTMNGVEFEVLKVPANNQFVVQHPWTGVPGDPPAAAPAADTNGTVRSVGAPGSLRIVPAAHVTTATTVDNEDNFQAAAYTVKEEGSSIVFRYDAGQTPATAKFNVYVDGQLLDTTTFLSARLNFDNRGFPTSLQVVGRDSDPVLFGSQRSVGIVENIPSSVVGTSSVSVAKAPRQVLYEISATGKVNTQAAY